MFPTRLRFPRFGCDDLSPRSKRISDINRCGSPGPGGCERRNGSFPVAVRQGPRAERFKGNAAGLGSTPTSAMKIPLLPQELFDHTISCIPRYPEYMDTLRAASLVCRAWAIPARRAIFRSIHLELAHVNACAALLQLLDETPVVALYIKEVRWHLLFCGDLNNAVVRSLIARVCFITVEHDISHSVNIVFFRSGARDFATVLDMAPALAPFVRDVMWSFNDGRPGQWTDSNVGALALARRLRNIRKVTLRQIGSCLFTATAPFGVVSDVLASASVRALHLRNVILVTMAEYTTLVSSLSRLEDLRLS
jgi:hypothetical protein